jgi:hypothetical protein
MSRLHRLTIIAIAVAAPLPAFAGAYVFSSESTPHRITHPKGFTGAGGVVTNTVCIATTTNTPASMDVPLRNAIDHWNQLVHGSANVRLGADNAIPGGQIDWESTMMHEMGHCIGIAHPNLASESGLSGSDTNYTKTSNGVDDAYNLGIGADNVRGSGDDARGDDENFHWYRKGVNNPFRLVPPIQASTYTRALADLPAGQTFAANGDRALGTLLGFPNTEAILQQGQGSDEDQRTLTADDVATLMLARTGLDGVPGTSDDYTVALVFGGVADNCDITAIIDPAYSALAVCEVGGSNINSNHIAITSATMRFGGANSWYFSTTRVPAPVADVANVAAGGTPTTVNGGAISLIANDTHPAAAPLVMHTSAVPGPEHGTVTLLANGSFTYTHNGDTAVVDSFAYRVCVATDLNACSIGRVTINIANDLIFKNGFQ